MNVWVIACCKGVNNFIFWNGQTGLINSRLQKLHCLCAHCGYLILIAAFPVLLINLHWDSSVASVCRLLRVRRIIDFSENLRSFLEFMTLQLCYFAGDKCDFHIQFLVDVHFQIDSAWVPYGFISYYSYWVYLIASKLTKRSF